MSAGPILAWVAHSLPAESWEERAELARANGLALEVAHGRGGDVERALELGVAIATIQAFGLHEGHALSSRPERARAGLEHLLETIEIAGRAGVGRVLAVCGFGHEPIAEPFNRSLAFFRAAIDCAREARVRVVIELLGARRAGAMTEPAELETLLDQLAAPDVFTTAIDTGHLLDAGVDPAQVLAGWRAPLEELQFRGPGSRAPSAAEPVERWLESCRAPPAVVCVEHRASADRDAFGSLVDRLRRALARAGLAR